MQKSPYKSQYEFSSTDRIAQDLAKRGVDELSFYHNPRTANETLSCTGLNEKLQLVHIAGIHQIANRTDQNRKLCLRVSEGEVQNRALFSRIVINLVPYAKARTGYPCNFYRNPYSMQELCEMALEEANKAEKKETHDEKMTGENAGYSTANNDQ